MSLEEWPAEAHGIRIPLDSDGSPRLFTTVDSPVQGVGFRRRMTASEVEHWIESKTGDTKVRPLAIDGVVP